MVKKSYKMLRIEYLVLCISLVLICKQVAARSPPKVQKRHDEVLQTYIYEPNDDYQADATTAFPPLVEYDSNNPPIVADSVPGTAINVPEDTPEAPPLLPPPPKPQDEVVQTSKSPEGPVGQYVNSYGGPYYTPSNLYPPNQYPSNSLPTNQYPNNYYPGYPWQYIPQPPYSSQQNGQQSMPTSYFPMQPEYEGVLVPVQTLAPPQRLLPTVPVQSTPQTNPTNSKHLENKLPPVANRNSFDLAIILQALLPPSVISFIIAIGNFILNSFSTLAFAGAITSVLCSLTPICTISFGSLGFRQMLYNGGEVTTLQRVRRAAEVVSNALEKYEKLQKGVESLTNSLKKAQRNGRQF